MIKRVGFFHFGSLDKTDPIASLGTSLAAEVSKNGGLNDCLLVVPEAFNIRNDYHNHNRNARYRDPLISKEIKRLSVEFEVAFVAGLIESGEPLGSGYSSAYLIDGDVCKLLSRKMEDDGSHNYKVCPENCDRPILHRGICIAALLCKDASNPSVVMSPRQAVLLERIPKSASTRVVLCVPAAMTSVLSRLVVNAWPTEIAVIVSNSDLRQPSVMRIGSNLTCLDAPKDAVSIAVLQ